MRETILKGYKTEKEKETFAIHTIPDAVYVIADFRISAAEEPAVLVLHELLEAVSTQHFVLLMVTLVLLCNDFHNTVNILISAHTIACQIGYCVGGNFNIHIWA